MNKANKLKNQYKELSKIFALFSSLLLYPRELSPDLINSRIMLLQTLLAPLADEHIHLNISKLQEIIKNSSDDFVCELEVEYNNLFLVPSQTNCYPAESKFQNDDPTSLQLYSNVTSELTRIYKDFGFRVSPAFFGTPDHIAIEFSFASEVANEIAESSTEPIPEDLEHLFWDFLDNHILQWFPELANYVYEYSGNSFYLHLFRLIDSYTALLA